MRSLRQRSFGWLKKIGTIKVCVQPEEEAIASQACEIHVSKFVRSSIDPMQCSRKYSQIFCEDSPTLRGHPLGFPWNSGVEIVFVFVWIMAMVFSYNTELMGRCKSALVNGSSPKSSGSTFPLFLALVRFSNWLHRVGWGTWLGMPTTHWGSHLRRSEETS